MQEVLNSIASAATSALVAVLVVAISALGTMAVQFIKAKIEEVQAKVGMEHYNQMKSVAFDVWNIVDEYFRITPTVTKTIEAAQAKFAEEIKKLIPTITDADIEALRQAIAGEINKGREALDPAKLEGTGGTE